LKKINTLIVFIKLKRALKLVDLEFPEQEVTLVLCTARACDDQSVTIQANPQDF